MRRKAAPPDRLRKAAKGQVLRLLTVVLIHALAACGADQFEDILRSGGDIRARSENRLHPGFAQEIIILLRDHAPANHDNVARILLLQRLDQLRCQGLVPRRLAGDADDMNIVINCVLRGFFRGLEQRANIDVKSDVGERSGDYLGAAIMAILTHLDHQKTRAAALFLGEGFDGFLDRGKAFVALIAAP